MVGKIFLVIYIFNQLEFSYKLLENPLRGKKVFVEKGCVNCHSLRGSGGKFGPDLALFKESFTFYKFAGLMFSHTPKMFDMAQKMGIGWRKMTADEMASLFSYLYYFNYFEEPGNYEDGQKIFVNKGCIKCHSIGGKKKNLSLDTLAYYRSPLILAVSMWNRAPVMIKDMERRGVKVPRLNGQDMKNILAFIRGRSPYSGQRISYIRPGDPREGRLIFEKKGCATCHSVHGGDNKIGPDLGKLPQISTVSEISADLWNHSLEMFYVMREKGITYPRFNVKEIADLIAYIYVSQYIDERGDIKKAKLFTVIKDVLPVTERVKRRLLLPGELFLARPLFLQQVHGIIFPS